eukprot:362516-Chlamydomonas_euryale.AAC.2
MPRPAPLATSSTQPMFHCGYIKTVIRVLRCISYHTSKLLCDKVWRLAAAGQHGGVRKTGLAYNPLQTGLAHNPLQTASNCSDSAANQGR